MHVLDQLTNLAHNLWWSWDAEATELWATLGAEKWQAGGQCPAALIPQLDASFDAATEFQITSIHQRFQDYMSTDGWCAQGAPEVHKAGVAYLSMEFGLHESVPLYSGGLGVLAGDHLRSASDLGVRMVGVSLLWSEGYFRQVLEDGQQAAVYTANDPARMGLRLAQDDNGPVQFTVPIGETDVLIQVWRLDVGRVPLYLMDANLPENTPEIRDLTSRLYGGDANMRCRQEALLGLGAIRLLKKLAISTKVVHLNEGHCAFAPLQMAADEFANTSDWPTALHHAAERCVFTTHTPVPAGHDRFGWSDVNGTLGRWRRSLGLPDGAFMNLGRVTPSDLSEPLCMTVLALRLSAAANGVAALHGTISRDMWKDLWPGTPVDDVPIGHVTNGVHPTFWLSHPTRALFDQQLHGWRDQVWDPTLWKGVDAISDQAIADCRRENRQALIDLVQRRCGVALDPNRLTLGFARRFAPYKRGHLIFRDPARLRAILEQGAQLVFAGKAHPRDRAGQAILAEVYAWSKHNDFAGRLVFIPDYDIEVGRAITAGSDVWLNNPRRPREASGTSGQKVVYNGGLNLSVLDGWWDEGYNGHNGWAIGEGREWEDIEAGDAADHESLMSCLEQQVMPLWQDAPNWWTYVRQSWKSCAPAFSSHRMVRDYVLERYSPRC